MAGITSLPVEILMNIASHGTRYDLKNLRLTCSHTNSAAEPHLFSFLAITVQLQEKPGFATVPIFPTVLVKYLATANRISVHVRNLVIDLKDEVHCIGKQKSALRTWHECLEPAICSFHGLRRVSWNGIGGGDLRWARESIMSALVSLNQLTVMEIAPWDHDWHSGFLEINKLQHLTRLSVRVNWGDDYDSVRSDILLKPIKLLLPQLASLALQQSPSRNPHITEHDISTLFSSRVPVSLSELSLTGLTLPRSVVQRLPSLTTLDVAEYPHDAISSLWTSLGLEHVFIRHLRASRVDDSLIQYLSSHSSLESLSLTGLTKDSTLSSCDAFFTMLPMHLSLNFLKITARSEFWSITQSFMTIIGRCRNLCSLHITPSPSCEPESLTHIIQTATLLPQLTDLVFSTIFYPELPIRPSILYAIRTFGPISPDTCHLFLRLQVDAHYLFYLDYAETENWSSLMFRQRYWHDPVYIRQANVDPRRSFSERCNAKLRTLLRKVRAV
ncbi:hypothetical protein C8J56DRAFT_196081 [Mycena floridula]|nr:hypothetical protein C8J56DRAFT_196081 [Mycena floridula]